MRGCVATCDALQNVGPLLGLVPHAVPGDAQQAVQVREPLPPAVCILRACVFKSLLKFLEVLPHEFTVALVPF